MTGSSGFEARAEDRLQNQAPPSRLLVVTAIRLSQSFNGNLRHKIRLFVRFSSSNCELCVWSLSSHRRYVSQKAPELSVAPRTDLCESELNIVGKDHEKIIRTT